VNEPDELPRTHACQECGKMRIEKEGTWKMSRNKHGFGFTCKDCLEKNGGGS